MCLTTVTTRAARGTRETREIRPSTTNRAAETMAQPYAQRAEAVTEQVLKSVKKVGKPSGRGRKAA